MTAVVAPTSPKRPDQTHDALTRRLERQRQ